MYQHVRERKTLSYLLAFIWRDERSAANIYMPGTMKFKSSPYLFCILSS